MREKQQVPNTRSQPYQPPQIVDSGSIVFKTQNNVAPEDWEQHSDNIVWGNLYVETKDDEK